MAKQQAMIVIVAALIAIVAVWVFASKGREKYTDWRTSYVTRIDLGKFTPFKNDKRQCPLGYMNNPASTGAADACKKRRLTVKNRRIKWVKKS